MRRRGKRSPGLGLLRQAKRQTSANNTNPLQRDQSIVEERVGNRGKLVVRDVDVLQVLQGGEQGALEAADSVFVDIQSPQRSELAEAAREVQQKVRRHSQLSQLMKHPDLGREPLQLVPRNIERFEERELAELLRKRGQLVVRHSQKL